MVAKQAGGKEGGSVLEGCGCGAPVAPAGTAPPAQAGFTCKPSVKLLAGSPALISLSAILDFMYFAGSQVKPGNNARPPQPIQNRDLRFFA